VVSYVNACDRVCVVVGMKDWHYRVIVQTDERGELILGAYERHRAAAKQYVQERLDIPVTEWKRCYIAPSTWDCPVCHTHEGMTKQPNMRGSHDWECMVCFSKAWGEPMDWEKIVEGNV